MQIVLPYFLFEILQGNIFSLNEFFYSQSSFGNFRIEEHIFMIYHFMQLNALPLTLY